MLARVNSGDLFNIGGNVKKTTVGEEIALLNTDLAIKSIEYQRQVTTINGYFYVELDGNFQHTLINVVAKGNLQFVFNGFVSGNTLAIRGFHNTSVTYNITFVAYYID